MQRALDQNVPLKTFNGSNSRMKIRTRLFAQGAPQLRKLCLLFIVLSDFEESQPACDGRRYFVFQTAPPL